MLTTSVSLKSQFSFVIVMLYGITFYAQGINSVPPYKYSLDKEWRFHQGDIPFPEIKGHAMSYFSAKAGKSWGAAAPEYNDKGWREITEVLLWTQGIKDNILNYILTV